MNKIIFIEPYYAGSHKTLMDLLYQNYNNSCPCQPNTDPDSDIYPSAGHVEAVLAVMTGKKWPWRARCSSLHFAQSIPKTDTPFTGTIFASCVLPLHELIALRPDLLGARKIIYFHENQLIYPKQKTKERDFQFGYNQVLSCLAADVVIFNSNFNKESFLSNLKSFFKLQPDYRPKNMRELLEPKCKVIYFPIDFSKIPRSIETKKSDSSEPVKLVWPHRWEHDKNPEMFFRVMYQLVEQGITNFRLSILGENFTDNPPIFEKAKEDLKNYILHYGFVESKEKYYEILCDSDIVISTADHEFFGVAMVEAVYCGCYPLCPAALVYPEIFPECKNSFYASEKELFVKLKSLIIDSEKFRLEKKHNLKTDFSRFDWSSIKRQFDNEFNVNCSENSINIDKISNKIKEEL